MSGAVIHVVVPTLALLATGLFPRRKVLMFAPFAVLSDIDFIFNFAGYYIFHTPMLWHRLAFHNLFIALPALVPAAWLWWRHIHRDATLRAAAFRTQWEAYGRVPWAYACVLIAVFVWSHVFLDMFQGGVTLFWPLVNTFVYPRIVLWVNTETGAPRVEGEVVTGEGAPALSPEYPVVTPEQFAILLIALVAVVVALWYESRWASRPAFRRSEEAPPVPSGDERDAS